MKRCLLSVLAALSLVALSPAASPARTLVVSAGALRVAVDTSPFRLKFTQAGGAGLQELSGSGASVYGTLGFGSQPVPPWGGLPTLPAGALWWHARQVSAADAIAGGGLQLNVATDDPLGRGLRVRIVPDGAGVIAVHASITGSAAGVTQMADAFATGPDEHFSGFGGRENAVDERGQTVESWSEEGSWTAGDRPFIPPFIEPWTYSVRDDGAYFPMPWLVSSRGYGFLLDNSERSLFRLASDRSGAWDVEADARHLDYRVFAGPTPLGVVKRFSATVGRQPAPAAPWVLGPWWQPTGPAQASLPARFRREDVPGSLIMTYTHYLPCGGQLGRTADEQALTAGLHAQGYAVTTYFNPMICSSVQPAYGEARAAGALLRNGLGLPYPIHYNQYLVNEFDFSSGAAVSLYQRLLGEAVANGYDGWMEDFGEYTPADAVAGDGTPGTVLHNLYPRLYHCAAYGLTSREPRPVIEFDRSGWTGSARCSPVVWSGDPTTDWGFDGLASMAVMGVAYGYSGVGIYGSDIGGYFSISRPPPTGELLDRWLELGAFSGVMRTESEGFTTPQWTAPRAQIWDPAVEPIWRRYAKLRTQLYPYIAEAASRYVRDGVPLMEGLGLAYPQDASSWTGPVRYLFGPDLLVAPVVSPGARVARVPLPSGRWRDFWQAVAYDGVGGGFSARGAPTVAGGTTVSVSAPLEQIPLFIRDGALVPMLSPDVATLAAYGSGIVHLGDRLRSLRLLAWPAPGPVASATALGARLRSRLSADAWSLRVAGYRHGRLSVQAALPWRPVSVRFAGRVVPARRWRFADGVLSVALRGDGLLSVRR